MLPITLAAGDEFKAVKAEGTTIITWYPDGMDNNYGQNGEIPVDAHDVPMDAVVTEKGIYSKE